MSLDEIQQSSFQRLGEVHLVEADSTLIRFQVDGHPIVVSAHTDATLRLRIGESALPDYGLLQHASALGKLELTTQASGWRIANGDTSLIIESAPLRFTVQRAGKTILNSITDQHFRGRTRLPSVGLQAGSGSRRWCTSWALQSDTAVYGFGEKFGVLLGENFLEFLARDDCRTGRWFAAEGVFGLKERIVLRLRLRLARWCATGHQERGEQRGDGVPEVGVELFHTDLLGLTRGLLGGMAGLIRVHVCLLVPRVSAPSSQKPVSETPVFAHGQNARMDDTQKRGNECPARGLDCRFGFTARAEPPPCDLPRRSSGTCSHRPL